MATILSFAFREKRRDKIFPEMNIFWVNYLLASNETKTLCNCTNTIHSVCTSSDSSCLHCICIRDWFFDERPVHGTRQYLATSPVYSSIRDGVYCESSVFFFGVPLCHRGFTSLLDMILYEYKLHPFPSNFESRLI